MMDYREPFHALADAGRYEEALAYLRRFYGHAFEEPFYFANMGWLCNQLHDHEGAFGYLMTGIRLFPDDGWMHAQLGMTQNRRERYAHALVCLEDALSLGFDEPWVHYELFLAHRELRQEEEAIARSRTLCLMTQSSAAIWRSMAACCCRWSAWKRQERCTCRHIG